MDALASSTSLNTLPRSMTESVASSFTVKSARAFATYGGSLTSLTVTTKTSSTVWPLDRAVTVIIAVPFWSGRKCRVSVLPTTFAVTSPELAETAVLTMDALASSTSLNTLDKLITKSAASSFTDTSATPLITTGPSSTAVTVRFTVMASIRLPSET